MLIVAHHGKFYDWKAVPPGVVVSQRDIDSRRVRPDATGTGWLARVTLAPVGGTVTAFTLGEQHVVSKIIHQKTRPGGGQILTRKEAITAFVAENQMPEHTHPRWVTLAEVHDDGGHDEALLRAMLAPHTLAEADRIASCKAAGTHNTAPTPQTIEPQPLRCAACGAVDGETDHATEPNIPAEDIEAHVSAYMADAFDAKSEPAREAHAAALVAHLHKAWRVTNPKPSPSAVAGKAVSP